MKQKYRCAIYTRKSTEDGLEQDFNSLDAQREACEAYIKSQLHEGWKLLPGSYDDGGISGGTMERPALQRLLDEVRAGRVDIIVVYKVDRLTRALSDFAKIVDLFDEHDVSFISVTQQFNTTTSMGRLTLNVLLSFAQFEREITAERIRDKIAASKKRGIWMGGPVPLGYNNVEKKLVINEKESEIVRALFALYLQLGNVRLVKEEAHRRGLKTKRRRSKSDILSGGQPLTRGHIYKLLTNPIYAGDIPHKGECYHGKHDPLVDRAIWRAAQSKLKENASERAIGTNTKNPSLLAGLLWDENGNRLVPNFACKKGRRYHYYVSRGKGVGKQTGWRLPAKEIESVVLNALTGFLNDDGEVVGKLAPQDASPDIMETLVRQAGEYAGQIATASHQEQRLALRTMIRKTVVGRKQVSISINRKDLIARMGIAEHMLPSTDALMIDLPVAFKKRGVGKKLIIAGDGYMRANPDPMLIDAVAIGRMWFERLRTGEVKTITDLARSEGVDRRDAGRTVELAFLAPDIIEAIIAGRQPPELMVSHLKPAPGLPFSWSKQRKYLGFSQ